MKPNSTFFVFIALGLTALSAPKISGMGLDQNFVEAIQAGDAEKLNAWIEANPHLVSTQNSANTYLYHTVQQAQSFLDAADALVEQKTVWENAARRCLGFALLLTHWGADMHSLSAKHQEILNHGVDLAFREAINDADTTIVALMIEKHRDFIQDQNRLLKYCNESHAIAQRILKKLDSLEPLPSTKEMIYAYGRALKIIELFEKNLLNRQDELKEDITVASEIPFSLSPPTSRLASRRASAQQTPVRPLPFPPLLPIQIAEIKEVQDADQALAADSLQSTLLEVEALRPIIEHRQLGQLHPEQNLSSSCPCATCVIL
jgi:hypothetical protein